MSSIAQVAAEVGDAATVLVLCPQAAAVDDAEYKRRFAGRDPGTELLGISFARPPSAWYDAWCDALGETPDAAAVITTPELASDDVGDRDLDVKAVSPSNLTRIGVKSTQYLSEWSHPIVTVESVTILLQYADAQSVYRFLHVLTTRLRTADATGLFHLDPSVTDDRTVELLKTLFDAVVECESTSDDGTVEWTAQLRDV